MNPEAFKHMWLLCTEFTQGPSRTFGSLGFLLTTACPEIDNLPIALDILWSKPVAKAQENTTQHRDVSNVDAGEEKPLCPNKLIQRAAYFLGTHH